MIQIALSIHQNVSSVFPACRKRRLIGAVCRNHRIKRLVPCRCRTGTLKNPTKCLWRWEPDRRYNFFLGPPAVPAHLCAVAYMTEIISLIVTLNNQFNSTQFKSIQRPHATLLFLELSTCMIDRKDNIVGVVFQVFKILWCRSLSLSACLSYPLWNTTGDTIIPGTLNDRLQS